jgi:hypothetical protein
MKHLLLFLLLIGLLPVLEGFPQKAHHANPLSTVGELRDSFSVSISGKSLMVTLCPGEPMRGNATLMNIVGQVVESWPMEWEGGVTQTRKMNLKDHPAGIYIFTMKVNGQVLSRRVVI